MFVLGLWVAVVMGRFHGGKQMPAFYSYRFHTQRLLPFYWLWESAAGATVSIIGGTLFLSSCVLTSAGFGRFPIQWLADHWFYAGVDCLILTGVLRDILMQHTLHTVYRIAHRL